MKLAEALKGDRSGYEAITKEAPAVMVGGSLTRIDNEPGSNAMIRCPFPPVAVTPDSLRQFFQGQVPQARLVPPPNSLFGQITTVVKATSVATSTSSSGSSTSTTANNGKTLTASTTTEQIDINIPFLTSFQVATAFQLVSLAATGTCRVELYGSLNEQNADFNRGVDVPPPAGTMQGIITDVVLDIAPYIWYFQNRVGVNNDDPQSNILYATITNIGQASDTFSITLTYVQLEV